MTYIFFDSTFSKGGMDIEQQSAFNYKLKIHGEHKKSLMISLVKSKLLPCVQYNSVNEDLTFVAESVDTLERTLQIQKMSHNTCVQMIYCISKQLDELESLHKMFYGLDLSDILVINHDIFVIANPKYLMPMIDKHITFYAPFQMPSYSSPELQSIQSIPAEVHFKTIYYSLGRILQGALLPEPLIRESNYFSEEELEQQLSPILYTKMYWFLKRCFEKEPSKRSLLFI
jgi:hypothetical protein